MVAVIALVLLRSPFADLVGQPADVAGSAYKFRADRKLTSNPPESFLALEIATNHPLNQKLSPTDPAIHTSLCSLLWEENRPIESLVLEWPTSAHRIPRPEELEVDALIPTSSANSWWNNLAPRTLTTPVVSVDGHTLKYTVSETTCGLVVRLRHGVASDFDVPTARAYVADAWKPMSLDIEWGFKPGTQGKDYSGRIEAYDGHLANVAPLTPDSSTETRDLNWSSSRSSASRRGIHLDMLYLGSSVWPKVLKWTTQPFSVARTIVTVWTKAGNFSFNPADLENGPIYAPEYGFYVRRTSEVAPTPPARPLRTLFTNRMNGVAQNPEVVGWGTAETPLICANPTDHAVDASGINLPSHAVAVHPGASESAVVSWRCPAGGTYTLNGGLEHAQAGGIGIRYQVIREWEHGADVLLAGHTDGKVGRRENLSSSLTLQRGDQISLVVANQGDYRFCTLRVGLVIEGGPGRRRWNLANDVAGNLLTSNPHADRYGNADTWSFCSELTWGEDDTVNSPDGRYPLPDAASGAAYLAAIARRNWATIREQTRNHAEMTWDAAVRATRGGDLPPIPEPPAGALPKMRIDVPDGRLQAQWNLGAWHLTRHCGVNPTTGKLWFNDYPYGILAAETYLILSALDQMGEHSAAQDGFDQWTMLPLDRNHPVGQFTDGRGALTFAEGPPGAGGQMDGIHAFGPGSIGWALAQHFALTGDTTWLKANAARLKANADWMLRQREVNRTNLPGGRSLWCAGLEPALQVTPDSGGLWMQFYEAEGYYCSSIAELAKALAAIGDPDAGRLARSAAAYRRDLQASVDRSIALSPVIAVRDGTYHSVLPFACYCRGAATGAWGWMRDGSGQHVGPLYWDTVQNGASLVWPARILAADDVRVQGYLDVLEDRFLLENPYVGDRDWFFKGWQYQGGLERTANLNLVSDDPPVFLRTFLNDYAVDILPHDGYVFNEHAVHGPPDKIFEEAAFLERFRDMLVMEEGDDLWIARAIPAGWLIPGNHVSVEDAPTRFGDLSYRITADTDSLIHVAVTVPGRRPPKRIILRLRVPVSQSMVSVTLNGKPWRNFDPRTSTVWLTGVTGDVEVLVRYR